MKADLIVVDWGSSNLRAHLITIDDDLLNTRTSTNGIGHSNKEELPKILAGLLEGWPQVPILGVGMVGSKNGLLETAYLPCPLHTSDLSANLKDASDLLGREMYIVPGCTSESTGFRDVMRGEESIIASLLPHFSDCVVCMPGTHSKWCSIAEQTLTAFQTYPSGELFHCLPLSPMFKHSFSPEAQYDHAQFIRGVQLSQDRSSLLHQLFALRSNYLFEQDWNGHSFLSGLLIGHEITQAIGSTTTICLIANPLLQDRYRSALEWLTPNLSLHLVNEQEALLDGARNIWRLR